jgi:UDP-GlcNAc3NAcA epimerase
MKIVTIVGARPQFIKAAVVSRKFSMHSEIKEIIVHTGQHFDKNMSDVFFEEMEIPQPHYNLSINNLSHGAMTGRMMEGIEKILMKEEPDYLLVYGDTNSTIAGTLAAKKLFIKVIHVEAGLRSFNMKMPEEINRILTDRISDILFCPTDAAIKNLEEEGFKNFKCEIVKSGDVMQDAALYYSKKSSAKSTIIKSLHLAKFILCTFHRQENINDYDNLSSIIDALNTINIDIPVIVPMHPRTTKILKEQNLKTKFLIIDPVGYFDMIELLKHCTLVMTDSGGLQKEAFFFRKHCITLRDETEWVELVTNGFNITAGTKKQNIMKAFRDILNRKSNFEINLYGEGKAGEDIVQYLLKK